MLPGFSGHLISEIYLERCLEERPDLLETVRRRHAALAEWRKQCRALGPVSGLRLLFEVGAEPLVRALGFAPASRVTRDRDIIAATLSAPADAESAGSRHEWPFTLIVAGWGARLDRLWRPAVVEARDRGASWCVLFNGTHIRIVNARRLYSRRYVELDLDLAVDDDRTCAVLMLLFAERSQVPGPRPEALVEASDRHASVVCRSLRDGVLQASARVLVALTHRSLPASLDNAFEQALTIVYRILFLLFAEARRLVPVWHPVYRESYSLGRLREGAVDTDRSSLGLWDTLRAVSRLAHSGCRAGDLVVTPFNGRLFAPAKTPLAERRDLDDGAAREALVALATRPAPDGAGREPIAYRDLGVEQLGAVYETLLDYAPRLDPSSRLISLEPGSGVRKATGTFYTPQSLAHYLVRRSLAPLVRDATPDRILALRVLDPAMGSGAFLVASCAFLADAYESAMVRDGACRPNDLGPGERASIRRTVAERCLFGVDLNPMAVQLARLSLWLATLAADRPLSFLDHHLQTGDSLIGAWLASLGQPPRTVRRRSAPRGEPSLFDDTTVREALRVAVPLRFSLALEPNDTPEHVRQKERRLSAIGQPDTLLSKWKRVADLWCSHWFADGAAPSAAFGPLSDEILTGRSAFPPSVAARYLENARAIATARRFFHWELEFPEAFFDERGTRLPDAGFDAVLGNPPWDMIRADTGPNDRRSDARAAAAATVRFTRDSGIYSAQSEGHANRYQLFVERAVALARPGGRIGLVLPSGLIGDHGSAPLRRLLFSRCGVETLVGFDNSQAVFPIHRSVRFLLMTATNGIATTAIGCRLGERDPAVLETEGDEESWFPVRVSPSLLRRLSGDDLALPELRSPIDLAIAERVAALFPALGDSSGWGARFGRELNATDDRHEFRATGAGLPVLEGKHIEPFRVDASAIRWRIAERDANRLLGTRHLRRRLGYRDVASSTNRLTLIAALLPAHAVSTHTIFCLRTPLSLQTQYFLCGLFNSFVVNYLVRLRVTTHVTTAIVERLAVPRLDEAHATFGEIARLALALAHHRSSQIAATLQARVARLYQLTSEEFEHVLATFPLVPAEERDLAKHEFLKM